MNEMTSAILFTVGFHLVNLIDLLYKWKRQSDLVSSEVEDEKNQVNLSRFIYGEASKECEKHLFQKNPCHREACTYRNMRKLLEGLGSCRKTLDICINLLSCNEVAECILDAALLRNVKVRIICDHIMAKNLGSQIPMLVKAGIDVKIPSDIPMHSKFAIVDSRTLIIGSLNWTVQGLHGNWDAFVVTTQPDIVKDYVKNFNLMLNHPKIINY